MEVRAVAKFVRVQPRKVRQVAREVRGKPALSTADLLRFHPSKSAAILRKVIMSAVANAQENHGADPDTLKICEIQVNEGPRMKRIRPRAMGRASRILKRTSHITVVVDEAEQRPAIKPHGTKPKPRPGFDKPKAKKKKTAKPKEEAAVADETAETSSEPETEATGQTTEEVTAEEGTEQTAAEEPQGDDEKTDDAEEKP